MLLHRCGRPSGGSVRSWRVIGEGKTGRGRRGEGERTSRGVCRGICHAGPCDERIGGPKFSPKRIVFEVRIPLLAEAILSRRK